MQLFFQKLYKLPIPQVILLSALPTVIFQAGQFTDNRQLRRCSLFLSKPISIAHFGSPLQKHLCHKLIQGFLLQIISIASADQIGTDHFFSRVILQIFLKYFPVFLHIAIRKQHLQQQTLTECTYINLTCISSLPYLIHIVGRSLIMHGQITENLSGIFPFLKGFPAEMQQLILCPGLISFDHGRQQTGRNLTVYKGRPKLLHPCISLIIHPAIHHIFDGFRCLSGCKQIHGKTLQKLSKMGLILRVIIVLHDPDRRFPSDAVNDLLVRP